MKGLRSSEAAIATVSAFWRPLRWTCVTPPPFCREGRGLERAMSPRQPLYVRQGPGNPAVIAAAIERLADELTTDRQERLVGDRGEFVGEGGRSSGAGVSGRSLIGSGSSGDGRGMGPVEEEPRDRQADPDDEAEEADGVHQGQPADPLGPEPLQVRRHADREERHGEEEAADGSASAVAAVSPAMAPGRARRQAEQGQEEGEIAEDERREPAEDVAERVRSRRACDRCRRPRRGRAPGPRRR